MPIQLSFHRAEKAQLIPCPMLSSSVLFATQENRPKITALKPNPENPGMAKSNSQKSEKSPRGSTSLRLNLRLYQSLAR